MAKEPAELKWIEELLPPDVQRKNMFGGHAYYHQEKIILVIFEKSGDYSYGSKKYPYELWNGCMFPCEHEKHPDILKLHSYLFSHPILGKWLYLPTQTENFDELVTSIIKSLKKHPDLFGSKPKEKKSKKKVASKKATTKKNARIDTKKPRMFGNK